MACTSCNEILLMSEKQGIEMDYCPNCRGIWPDRGALEKIMDRSAAHYSKKEHYEAAARRYGYGNHNHDYKRK